MCVYVKLHLTFWIRIFLLLFGCFTFRCLCGYGYFFFIFASTTDCTILFDFLLVWRWVALLLILLLLIDLPTVSVCVWPRRAGARTSLIARLFPNVARAKSKNQPKNFPFFCCSHQNNTPTRGPTDEWQWMAPPGENDQLAINFYHSGAALCALCFLKITTTALRKLIGYSIFTIALMPHRCCAKHFFHLDAIIVHTQFHIHLNSRDHQWSIGR